MIKIGDIEIIRIEEMMLAEPLASFAGIGNEELLAQRSWHGPNFFNENEQSFVTSIHVWLVKTPKQIILVDTGGGNGKNRPLSPRFHMREVAFLKELSNHGVNPEDVNLVLLTHLHVDHVGWNTMLVDGKWVPTFPNATYVISAKEIEASDPKQGGASRPPGAQLPFIDSVQPIIDAGLVRLVEGNETITDGIDLMPIPGHSPGQIAVRIRSAGKEALFIADTMHQPIQVYYPAVNSKYCNDQELARQTRAKVLAYAADHQALILPGHFGKPYAGYVERNGSDGFIFVPL